MPRAATIVSMTLALCLMMVMAVQAQDAAPTEAPPATEPSPTDVASATQPSGEFWLTDYQAARERAAAEGKDLLLDFTGSDWCQPCMILDHFVFSTPDFQKKIGEHFVGVKVDFPRAKPQAPELREQNNALSERFEIDSYPTIYLTDARGRAYARTGLSSALVGPSGVPDESLGPRYTEHLIELRSIKAERDRLLAEAAEKEGVEQAKVINDVLLNLRDLCQGALIGYDDLIEKIIDLDAENQAGLSGRWGQYLDGKKLNELIRGDPEKFIAAVDAFIAKYDPEPEYKQYLTTMKGVALFNAGRAQEALGVFSQAILIAPDSELAGRLPQMIAQTKQAIEAGAVPGAPKSK